LYLPSLLTLVFTLKDFVYQLLHTNGGRLAILLCRLFLGGQARLPAIDMVIADCSQPDQVLDMVEIAGKPLPVEEADQIDSDYPYFLSLWII
jgi:hypothetical protein